MKITSKVREFFMANPLFISINKLMLEERLTSSCHLYP